MQKNFSFKGINRSTDVVLAQDGECLDIVNMRMSNGSLLPMPKPAKVAELKKEYSALYWHGIAECYVAVTNDSDATLHFYDKDFAPLMAGSAMLVIDGLRGVKRVEFIGNVVCCLTEDGILYLLFEQGTYRGLGERPQIPDVSVAVSSKVESVTTEETYYVNVTADDWETSWSYNEKGYIEECVSALNKGGHYVDRALFRVALRLYDGSYVNVSEIIYVSDETNADGVGRDAGNMQSEAVDSTSPSRYKVKVRGFKPEFSFDTSALAAWRNIVVGIDIFSTVSITGKRCDLVGRGRKFEMYTAKSLDALWEDVSSASLYYKIAEYDIDGNRTFRLEDVSPASLALQQGLETEAVPSFLSGYGVQSSFVYNGRLHIAAFKEYFFKGYGAAAYCPVAGDKAVVDAMVVRVKIRSTQGDFVVEKQYDKPTLGYDGYMHTLPPMLTYPDVRACEMSIYVKNGQCVYGKVLPLCAHRYLNVAYYLHKWYSPYSTSVAAVFANGGEPLAGISSDTVLKLFNNEVGTHNVVYSASGNCWTYKGKTFPPSEYSTMRIFAIHRNAVDGDKLVFTIKKGEVTDFTFRDIYDLPIDNTWTAMDKIPDAGQEVMPYEMRRNVMKVSMVENPFVFPARCTYTPSQSAIVGLSSNTVSLSQGQFGQFPLYVFCEDGIWTMSVDSSGSVAYLSCNQVSRDICVNGDTICGISGGVVFAGKQGMVLVSGNSISKFSSPMDGNAPALAGVPDDIFSQISSLVSLQCKVDSGDFQNYVAGGFVACLPSHGEVLINNSAYGYSYVYSFATGVWVRYTGIFAGEVKGLSRPHFFTVGNGVTSVFSIPDEVSGDNRVLLFTRPQVWGTKLPKRIMQLLLHTYVHPPESAAPALFMGCYMLASNDGIHFKLIAGSEKKDESQDMLFPYFPTQSYKYYLFAVVGNLGKESVVTAMEVNVDVPWRNRLR